MTAAGKVTRDKEVAQVIEVAGGLIDGAVLDQGLVGEARVQIQEGLHTESQVLQDLVRDLPQSRADFEEIRLQALVVEGQAHSISV